MPSMLKLVLLAACAVLALGCDYSNVTGPQPLPNPLAEVTALSVSAVAASGHQPPNAPENTRDNDLGTRWSQEGDGQWIQYDLGAARTIGRLEIAWYQTGTGWESVFDIQVSSDAGTWTTVFSGRSSAGNVQPQGYGFPTVTGRYVRVVGHGQWNGATFSSWWNSITEVNVSNASFSGPSVVASEYLAPNVPGNTLDNNLGTRWSAHGDGQWIQYDLGAPMAIGRVDITWYQGGSGWESVFDIQVSSDASTWKTVFSGRSSAGNVQPQGYGFPTVTGRYVRVVGHGQWNGAALNSWWNSITEVNVSNASFSGPSVVASEYLAPNVPGNTLDNNLGTRWSAQGDGQWIQYDLGAPMAIGRVEIAWYQGGNGWESMFDIQVSFDASTWTTVFSGRSNAGNVQPQGYGFPSVTGRYVRVVGHGQWNGATLSSSWNSITEVDIYNVLPVSGVGSSGYQDPNLPRNTLDNALETRWSAKGDGQWIGYDLGSPRAIGGVDIAWYQQAGQQWESVFDIEVSPDALTWTKVFSGRSNAGNVQYQRYVFPAITCRYIRIVGHGQWNGATLSSSWNSITEVDVRPGSAAANCSESTTEAGRVTGLGTLGTGSPSPGSDRQEFDFNVAEDLSGRLFYRDWSVDNGDGTVGTITVDPSDPQTAITAYRDSSDKCADSAHGAAFDGIGRRETGDLRSFTINTCDDAAPGSGADFFQIDVGEYNRGGLLSGGDVTKSSGKASTQP